MSNQIRNFRAALAQNDRNKPLFTFFVIELAVVSLILAGILGYVFDSDAVFGYGFIIILSLLSAFLTFPLTAVITFVILALGWAAPFVALGIYWHNGWCWFLGACAFVFSFVVNYWGFTYLSDLVASDDD